MVTWGPSLINHEQQTSWWKPRDIPGAGENKMTMATVLILIFQEGSEAYGGLSSFPREMLNGQAGV